jgi:hypothetical protein
LIFFRAKFEKYLTTVHKLQRRTGVFQCAVTDSARRLLLDSAGFIILTLKSPSKIAQIAKKFSAFVGKRTFIIDSQEFATGSYLSLFNPNAFSHTQFLKQSF